MLAADCVKLCVECIENVCKKENYSFFLLHLSLKMLQLAIGMHSIECDQM